MPANRPNTGCFQKGKSGNPSGRPKKTKEQTDALEAIRQLSPMAVETLKSLLNDPDQPGNVRVKAVEIILDRTYGKPEQSVKVSTNKTAMLDDIQAELDNLREVGGQV